MRITHGSDLVVIVCSAQRLYPEISKVLCFQLFPYKNVSIQIGGPCLLGDGGREEGGGAGWDGEVCWMLAAGGCCALLFTSGVSGRCAHVVQRSFFICSMKMLVKVRMKIQVAVSTA